MFISDISKKTGLSIHTLRYYEQIGLLKNIHRNQSGRRVYTKLDLEWLEWVKRLKSTGMPLEKMQDFAQFRLQGVANLKTKTRSSYCPFRSIKTRNSKTQARTKYC